MVDSHDRRTGLEVHIRPWSYQVDSGSGPSVARRPVGLGGYVDLDEASAQLLCSNCSKRGCVRLGRRCSCCAVSSAAT